MKRRPRYEDWGPASALAIVMEEDDRALRRSMTRSLSVCLYGQYGPGGLVLPYSLPSHKLRARAVYGGKKGRRAIQRLRARGLGPVYMQLFTTTPIYHAQITL